jgi:anti-sigma factor ChrR (cupin superfamily)
VLPLHEHGPEHVALVRWVPSTKFMPHQHWGGEKILVLDGVFEDEHGTYPKGSWLRSPHLSAHNPFTGPDGALIYVKTGHLAAFASSISAGSARTRSQA